MGQISFSDAEYAGKRKKTRREVFLEEMELVVPWKALLGLIEPHYPVAGRGRRPYPLESMLRVHLMQNWFALSDPAMEEALYEIASLRAFAQLSLGEPIPDETTILNFRHLLEANDLAEDILKAVNAHLARKGLLLKRGSIVDATIIAAPSSTKNAAGRARPGDAPDQEGQPVALRHEGAHRGRRRQRPGAHGHHHGGQRGRRRADRRSAAWQGAARVGRLGLPRRADARGARGPAVAHRSQAERHRQAARRARASNGSRSTSTARPACAPRSSTRFASSSASSGW